MYLCSPLAYCSFTWMLAFYRLAGFISICWRRKVSLRSTKLWKDLWHWTNPVMVQYARVWCGNLSSHTLTMDFSVFQWSRKHLVFSTYSFEMKNVLHIHRLWFLYVFECVWRESLRHFHHISPQCLCSRFSFSATVQADNTDKYRMLWMRTNVFLMKL